MRQPLPWESVPPPIYTARNPKPRKKWVTVGGWILVIVLMLFGLSAMQRKTELACISLVFSALYCLTLLMKKDAVVTTRGIEIFYQMYITTNYDFYPWERITSIVREDRGHAELIRLHFGFEATEKALYFTYADAAEVEKLALKMKPSIRIVDYEVAPKKTGKRKRK